MALETDFIRSEICSCLGYFNLLFSSDGARRRISAALYNPADGLVSTHLRLIYDSPFVHAVI